jgi:hypothetical protein
MAWILDPHQDEHGEVGGWTLSDQHAEPSLPVAEWPDDYDFAEVLSEAMAKLHNPGFHPVVRPESIVPGTYPPGSWVINDVWDF